MSSPARRSSISISPFQTLNRELGITRLLLEGGGVTNGNFLRAGLVDEVSLLVCPFVDGAPGAPSLFDAAQEEEDGQRASIRGMELTSSQALDGGVVWLRYRTIAPIKLTEALVPNLLRATSPKTIFISTDMASFSVETGGGEYIYRSSKAALNSAVRLLGMDLVPRGLAVAALHPGWVHTDMGGPNAPVSPGTSVEGMRAVIERLASPSGPSLINYDGRAIGW